MALQTSTGWLHLAPDPHSFYRQLFVKGTRVRARVVFGLFANADEPMAPEEIAADMNLPVEAVLEAIAYCQSKPPEIDEDYRREEALAQATGMADPAYKYSGKPKQLSGAEMARIRGQ